MVTVRHYSTSKTILLTYVRRNAVSTCDYREANSITDMDTKPKKNVLWNNWIEPNHSSCSRCGVAPKDCTCEPSRVRECFTFTSTNKLHLYTVKLVAQYSTIQYNAIQGIVRFLGNVTTEAPTTGKHYIDVLVGCRSLSKTEIVVLYDVESVTTEASTTGDLYLLNDVRSVFQNRIYL